MSRRILALVLCVCLNFVFAACGSDKDKNTYKDVVGGSDVKIDTSLQKGEPKAIGDVFKLPDIKRTGDNAPIISEATHQADPDDSIILTGEGFSDKDTKVYIYSQSTKDNGKVTQAKFTATSDEIMNVIIDKDLEYGMYGVYVENSKGKSNIELINKPVIWWIGFSAVNAGDSLPIYGENLTSDNADKSSVFLVADGEYCQAQITYADPYKVVVTVPEGLKDGVNYEVRLHNGHGGDNGFAVADEKIMFYDYEPFIYNGEVIDVTDFGAVAGKKNNDDTAAVQKAIDSAQDGDVIYFPKGTYLFKSNVNVTKRLQFKGAGKDKTKIVGGTNLEEYVFNVNIGPCEFKDMGFEHIRKSGQIKSGFIQIRCDNNSTDIANLYVHDCDFVQSVTKVGRSLFSPIYVLETYGAVIENNTFDSTCMVSTRGAGKVFLTNNDLKGHLYTGSIYYHQNTIFMHDSDMFDISNNKFMGKDALTDDSGKLSSGDLSTGRVMAIQGYGRNLYMSKNDIDCSGLPEDNAGEQIMLENISCEYLGEIKSSTAAETVMPDTFTAQVSRGMLLTIINGKGKGQVRALSEIRGRKITIDKPWDIVPDSTSLIFVTNCFVNIVIYGNDMDCYTNYAENPGATTGVQAYGGIYNMYITKNKFKNMPRGLSVTQHHCINDGDFINNTYWSNVDDNVIENACIGMQYNMIIDRNTSEKNVCILGLGVMFRGNHVKNIKEFADKDWVGYGNAAFSVGDIDAVDGYGGSKTWHGNWLETCVLENTVFENCDDLELNFYKHQENTIIRNNTTDGGKEAGIYVSSIGKAPITFK